MSHGLIAPSWGSPLNEGDYAALAACWISREIAHAAMLRRVDAHEGREVVVEADVEPLGDGGVDAGARVQGEKIAIKKVADHCSCINFSKSVVRNETIEDE